MNQAILNRNKNINRGYRKLTIWQEAIELYVFVRKKLRECNDLSYKVKDQIEGSAFSCHSNIAEGYSRRGLRENIQFNTIALASLSENYSQLYALFECNEVDNAWFDQYDAKLYSLENKLIKMNKILIEKMKKKDWNNDYVIKEDISQYNL